MIILKIMNIIEVSTLSRLLPLLNEKLLAGFITRTLWWGANACWDGGLRIRRMIPSRRKWFVNNERTFHYLLLMESFIDEILCIHYQQLAVSSGQVVDELLLKAEGNLHLHGHNDNGLLVVCTVDKGKGIYRLDDQPTYYSTF